MPTTALAENHSSAGPLRRLSVEQVVRRLKYFQAFEIQMARVLGGWLPGIARWEIKHEVGLHLWQDAQHSRDLRTRLWELRVSNPDRDVAENVANVIRGFAGADEDYEFLAGLYLVLKTELVAAYQAVMAATSDVYDAPTIAVISRILPEKMAQLAWAKREVAALTDDEAKRAKAGRWGDYCRRRLEQAGGVTGEGTKTAEPNAAPPPGYGLKLPFPAARRDERFQLSLTGLSVPAETDRAGTVLFQFFHYAQEMQAAETLGSMLWETDGMDWDFYFDVARHCYDEVRHSALGEQRLRELGHQVTDFPNVTGNYAWRQLVDPLRRYCVLTYVIEADSFKFKHQSYQAHLKNHDLESAEAVLFDIIDETMHVRLGQKWVPKLMQRYGYQLPLETLVKECREILLANSVSPLQRIAAAQVKGS